MNTKRSLAALATASIVVAGGAIGASADERPEQMRAAEVAAQADGGIRDTDAPRAVRVGASVFTLPVTVITDVPAEAVEAGLLYEGPGFVAEDAALVGYGVSELAEPGRPAVHKPGVEVYAEDLVAWGAHTWAIAGIDGYGTPGETLTALDTVPTEVKAHSLAGLRTSRVGATLRIDGSVRGYHSVQDRYVPLSGRTVSVQRWTGDAWVQVIGATADARGNFTTFVGQVGAGTSLRVVVQDAATVWGAVSTTVRAA